VRRDRPRGARNPLRDPEAEIDRYRREDRAAAPLSRRTPEADRCRRRGRAAVHCPRNPRVARDQRRGHPGTRRNAAVRGAVRVLPFGKTLMPDAWAIRD